MEDIHYVGRKLRLSMLGNFQDVQSEFLSSQSSRPRARKIAIVLAHATSPETRKAIVEAARAHSENIRIFVIGVGTTASDCEELELIAGSPEYLYIVSDVEELRNIKGEIIQHIQDDTKFVIRHNLIGYLDDVSRPLSKRESLQILWHLYPPRGSEVDQPRESTWFNPIVNGKEAKSLLSDEIKTQTSLLACFKLVLEARIVRDGYVDIPSYGPDGVIRTWNLDSALSKINDYIKESPLSQI